MFPDINAFIAELDRRKDLARIAEPVSPHLEIAAVVDRVCKSPGGGPALLFEKPTGATMPVAANLFGSMSRMCLALGVETLDELAHEIEELTTPPMPRGFMDALKLMPLVNRLTDLMPKIVKDAPCQEVVKMDGGLDELPVLTTWPEDGGPFITLPARHHARSRDRHAQHRHLPHAGVRSAHDRHALAASQRRRAAPSRGRTRSTSGWKWPSRSAPIRC